MNPFFIIGNPRSGTSLLRLMLNNHPQITVPPECGFALWWAEKYQNMTTYNNSVYLEFAKDVFKSKKFETWGITKNDVLETLISQQPNNYVGLVNSVYFSYSRFKKKKSSLFGDKNNYYISCLESLKSNFPDSKMLFIMRDGRDVACSYREVNLKCIQSVYKPKLPKTISDIANEWSLNSKQILKFQTLNSLTVRYEDIVQEPKIYLNKICKFLDVDYSEQMLLFYKNNDEPEDFIQWKEKTQKNLDARSVGRYVKELTIEEQETFLKFAGSMLKRFSYI